MPWMYEKRVAQSGGGVNIVESGGYVIVGVGVEEIILCGT